MRTAVAAFAVAALVPAAFAAPPAFLEDAVTVTLDGVALGSAISPTTGNVLRYTIAYDAVTGLYHLWTMPTDDFAARALENVVHATSVDGLDFTTHGALFFFGDPLPGPFSSTEEPLVSFLRAARSGPEWKLLVWTSNNPSGTYGEYNYNTWVNTLGTTPNNLAVLHQGPLRGTPGPGGFHVGPFGIVNDKVYLRVDDAQGGLGQFDYFDDFLPESPTTSDWGAHTTGDLFGGTPWVWGLNDPGAANAAYVHNMGRTLEQAGGTLGTYFSFRDWSSATRLEKQIWYVESNDGGAAWSNPAPVFADGDAVTADGVALGPNDLFGTPEVARAGDGYRLYFSVSDGTNFRLLTSATFRLAPFYLALDFFGNGVLEPGEVVVVAPGWRNVGTTPVSFAGSASGFAGPGTSTYSLNDGVATVGTVGGGLGADCLGTGDCYVIFISSPLARPSQHWHADFDENLTTGESKTWSLHVGGSFDDVASSDGYYPAIESAFHHEITAGCDATSFCPQGPVRRRDLAMYLLRAIEGPGYTPPTGCVDDAEVFIDVPFDDPYCAWIEDLYARGISTGCDPGANAYCPDGTVTREQMAVLVLRAVEGAAYTPAACDSDAELFADVPSESAYCAWVEDLAQRGATFGCGGGSFCPSNAMTREQMALLVTGGFALKLYRP